MTDTLIALSNCPLFKGFPPESLTLAAELGRCHPFAAGEPIYTKGNSAKALAVVASGSVRINSSNAAGKECCLIICGAGSWFGDAVFCRTSPRLYGAVAHEAGELLEFGEAEVARLMAAYPHWYPTIVDQLARRLCATLTIIEDDALRSIPVRVGRRLLFLLAFHGGGPSKHQPVTLKLTREQLGSMVGMTRQGVQKAIQVFEQEGLVTLDYGTVTLENPAALETFLDQLVD